MSVDPLQKNIPWQSPYIAMDNKPNIRNDVKGDCPTCVTGAIVSGLLELVFQVGEHMLQGEDFASAFSKVDWVDVGISSAGGAVTGAFTGGLGKLASVAADPKKRKVLQFVLEQGLDYVISKAEEELKVSIDRGALFKKLNDATGLSLGLTSNEIGTKGEKITKKELQKLYPNATIYEQVEGEFKDGKVTRFDFIVVDDETGEIINTTESKANSGRATDNQKRYNSGEEVTLKGKDIEEKIGKGVKIDKNKVDHNLSKVKLGPTGRKISQIFKKIK